MWQVQRSNFYFARIFKLSCDRTLFRKFGLRQNKRDQH